MIAMSVSQPQRGVTLARLAALFAAMFLISLGICGYSVHTGDQFGGEPGFLSFIGMLVSGVSLVVIGVTALIRKYN